MRVVQKGEKDSYEELYPDEYEFKLCGGSVEPKDRIIHPVDEAGNTTKETSIK